MTAASQPRIIIIGGGPAGTATALHLARNNPELAADTLMIEAQTYPRPKLCGGGVTFHGEEQLDQLGVTLDVPSVWIDTIIFRLGRLDFSVPFDRAMRVIQRSQFDAALADAARSCGITVHSGERLLDIHPRDGGGYRLFTDQATYDAQIIVAADGANSTVRRKLRFDSSNSTARLLRVRLPADTQNEEVWQRRAALFDFTCVLNGIQGYMWDFPCLVDGVPHTNRGIFDSRLAPARATDQPHGNLKRTFADWLAERDAPLADDTLYGHPVRWFNPQADFAKPHVLLVGDAAGVDALFAEGISYAMEYGRLAADAIRHAIREKDFSFETYAQRVRQHRLGKLLKRRKAAAIALYTYHYVPFWNVFWRLAAIAPRPMQQAFGAAFALLPASGQRPAS